MVKRKQQKDTDVAMGGTDAANNAGGDSSDEEMDIVNVDFEWFDPDPEVDFHGLKHLIRQLFDTDAQDFDLSALADLVLSQPLLGSTVKTDGKESDPYAFLTVLNLREHAGKPAIKDLTTYLHRKAKATPSLSPLATLLSQSPIPPIGLILTERLINMPVEVIPPMYTMLQEEITWALEENEPYNFSHYLIVSKTYEEVESKLDAEETRPQKKKKAAKGGEKGERFFFHPEDEVLERHALCQGGFEHKFDEGRSDSKRAFQELGIKTGGSLILLEAGKFEGAVKEMVQFVGGESA